MRWTGCACPEATLTIYRDGWPVLVSLVRGTDGGFDVPIWYTREAGDYAAQLRCMDGCARVEAGSVAPPMEEGPSADRSLSISSRQASLRQRPRQPQNRPKSQLLRTDDAIPTPQPTQAPTPRPTQAQGSGNSALAAEVVRQTNMERAARGLTELRVDERTHARRGGARPRAGGELQPHAAGRQAAGPPSPARSAARTSPAATTAPTG